MRIITKIISSVMIGMVLLQLAGCGEKEGQLQQVLEDKADVTFEGKNIEFGEIDGEVCHYAMKNGKLYMLVAHDTIDDEKKAKAYQFYLSDLDGYNTQYISSPISVEGNIILFCVDSWENITYIAASSTEDISVVELVKIDNSGKELLRKDITKAIKNDVQMISGLVSDAKGQIVLACGKKVYFFDEQFQSVGEVLTNDGYVIDIALTKNNELVCVTDNLDSDVLDINVCVLNVENKQWGNEINIRTGQNGETDCVFDGPGFDFYYKGRSGIYGYNMENGTSTELINYDASNMISADTEGMLCAREGVFIGKSEGFADEKSGMNLVLYSKKDMTTVSEKKVITFGTYQAAPNIKRAIAKYNRSNPEYEIVIQEYFEMDEERLLTDIITGNGSDIIDLSFFPLSVKQCVSKGLIEDLTPYYEKDPNYATGDIVNSVREAMEQDGKIYYISPGFSLTSAVAKSEVVGNKNGWTVKEFKELMEKTGGDVNVFSYEEVKISYLDKFINKNMEDYIDWEKGECNFESEEFRYILMLCNEMGMDEEENVSDAEVIEEVDSQYSRLKAGKYVLLENDSIDLHSIQLDRKAIGENVTYIGLPNNERQGSYFRFDNKFAISSQSKVKEQAWDFIRSFMSVNYQKSMECGCMPTLQAAFDNKLKELTATEPYVDEFGDSIQPIEQYTVEYGDIEIAMDVPTQEDIDVYLNLVNQTTRCVDGDMVVFNIIMEEAQGYFNGRKKLDKTIEVIQNRVTTYINEQK